MQATPGPAVHAVRCATPLDTAPRSGDRESPGLRSSTAFRLHVTECAFNLECVVMARSHMPDVDRLKDETALFSTYRVGLPAA